MKIDRRVVTRIVRRSRDRLTRTEALEVLQALRSLNAMDFLAFRTPGCMLRDWSEIQSLRAAQCGFALDDLKRFGREKFWHYGPRFGEWPGERRLIP